jgi:hypothetical protein
MKNGKRGPYDKPVRLDMPFNEAVERFSKADPRELSQAQTETNGPLSLVEDAGTGDRFLIYKTKRGTQVELQVDGNTFWATQQQMADAFGVTRQNVTMHLQNIFKEGELAESAVCKESLQTARDGKAYQTKLYNLNALISVGYRVGGPLGTSFRLWATDKLIQYIVKGFVIDIERLKSPGDYDRIAELRDIIRDIRASEANVYAELRKICAMCQDYDAQSESSREFYSYMQAKLYWAVTSHTPSEILKDRARAKTPNMGLQTWPKDEIRQIDALTAKNYLGQTELQELNRLTTILLDIFEDQLKIGKLTLMAEASSLLDAQLRNLNRAVLRGGGRVSHSDAELYARTEYKKFDDARRATRVAEQQEELARLAALKATEKSLPRPAKKMDSSK